MPLLTMKFGGTSVADLERMRTVASKIKYEVERGYNVIAVVSAMAGATNKLIGLVESTSNLFDAREYDAVVSTGESQSSGLLALTLQDIGIPARSWQGWQVPVITTSAHGTARITQIETENLNAKFAEGMRVAVVAGFQGTSPEGRMTTLGRGGSDTSAVAFATAFKSERCDIYTDVDGVYTADPRIVPNARKLQKISYEEMLELASLGAKVLQTRSVELAMRNNVRLCVRSSFNDEPGTLVCDEEEIMEKNTVSGIAQTVDEAKISILSVEDRPGIAEAVFGPLAAAGVNVDMIIQTISERELTDITFTCPVNQVELAESALKSARDRGSVGFRGLVADTDVCKVSVVGIGMRSHTGVASKMFGALAKQKINIKAISTSEIKISVLVDQIYRDLAVKALHDEFGLNYSN
ncbi:MAG: aspartate kinase [Albidovulum sp.]|nr:aspartate kinase [Albidovulum sp.]MDE0532851.1 aspartate kinase [Albidovulum sp.]